MSYDWETHRMAALMAVFVFSLLAFYFCLGYRIASRMTVERPETVNEVLRPNMLAEELP